MLAGGCSQAMPQLFPLPAAACDSLNPRFLAPKLSRAWSRWGAGTEMLELLLEITGRKINAWLDEITDSCNLSPHPGVWPWALSVVPQLGRARHGCGQLLPSSFSPVHDILLQKRCWWTPHPVYPSGSVAASFSLETPFQPSLQVIGS